MTTQPCWDPASKRRMWFDSGMGVIFSFGLFASLGLRLPLGAALAI